MIPTVSFIGRSNSGKTTFLEKVVRELKIRGYRIAVVKHTHHDFDMDHPGKDSWRFTRAGSDVVVLASPDKVAFVESLDAELTLTQITALFKDKVDIVITEGYKNGTAPKVLVVTCEQHKEQLCPEEKPLATVLVRFSPLGVPQFDDTDITRVVDLLILQIAQGSPSNYACTASAVA